MKQYARARRPYWLVAGMITGVLFAGGSIAGAGTIRHDRLDADYRAYASQFPSVGSYTASGWFGSFTLIAPQWALTAAHVVDINGNGSVADEIPSNHVLRLGGLERRATQLIVPTGINGNPGWNGNINSGFDIALVRLDQPITTIAPAPLYSSFQELGKVITSVGFGRSGTGETGAYLSAGVKRAGDNTVDEFVTFANGATALRWDFDEPAPRRSPNRSGSSVPLNMEYLIAGGDSGGGAFIFENNTWFLAGVHSGTYNFYNYPGATSDSSTYGDSALVTRVAAYQQFILSNIPELASIPEPSSIGLLATAGILLKRRRRMVG